MYSAQFEPKPGNIAQQRDATTNAAAADSRRTPNSTHASRPWIALLAFVSGCLSAGLGLAVMAGWETRNTTLTQLRPDYAPMAYNTALAFLLSGLALTFLAVAANHTRSLSYRISIALGIAYCIVIGSLTLAEYAFHWNPGIDDALMRAGASAPNVYPGRPSPNAAICILLTGIALLLFTRARMGNIRHATIAMLSSIIASIGIVASSGYALGINSFYAWTDWSRMAAHTAVGFVVVGAGILALAWSRDDRRIGAAPPWLPIPAGVGVAAAAFALFQTLTVHLHLWRTLAGPTPNALTGRWEAFNRTEAVIPVAALAIILTMALLFAWVIHLAQRAKAQSWDLQTANAQLNAEIAERVGLEKELAASNAELDSRVRERTRSETKFRGLLEAAPDAVVVVTSDGDIALANTRVEELFGYKRDEIIGKPVDILVPDRLRRSHAEHRVDFFRRPHARPMGAGMTLFGRRKDGREFPAEVSLSPLETDEGLLVSAAIRDITERKRQQEELERSNDLLRSTERDLRERMEREALVNKIGQMLRSSFNPEEIPAAAAAGEALQADRSYVAYFDHDRRCIRIGKEWHRADLPSLAGEYVISEHAAAYIEKIHHDGGTIVVNDTAGAETSYNGAGPLATNRARAFIHVPLFAKQRLIAAMIVEMTERPRVWTPDEVALIETIAALIRSAIETARVHQRERKIATALQQPLLPRETYAVPGLDIGIYYKPAMGEANVGGDFCDVFAVNDTLYALVVGDISGKGLAAAVQVATVRNMLRCMLYLERTLVEAVTKLNAILAEHNLINGFATLFVGLYHTDSRELTSISCNSDPMLILRSGTGSIVHIAPNGPPLSITDDFPYQVSTTVLNPGDVLLLYTDGLSEAGPDSAHLLGTEGVEHLLVSRAATGVDAKRLAADIADEAIHFANGDLADDVCLLTAIVRGRIACPG